MRVCLLASGSKGNAIYIETRESRVLVDAGLSAREIEARLARIGVSAADLHGVLVSHEHGDHCRGLGALVRRHRLPLFAHPQTLKALPRLGQVADVREFESGSRLQFRDLEIGAFAVTHDANAPVGFTLTASEGQVGIATDLGIATRLVKDSLQKSRVLILESNHDEELLRDGPYPWPLKQRVRSNHGHLSNAASADLLEALLWEGLQAVFLAHLSEVNNRPALAAACAQQVLSRQNCCVPQLIIGRQDLASCCFQA